MALTTKEKLSTLVIGCIGVVYGDIGTSPLYSLKSCFSTSGLPVTPESVIGLLSLFVWSLNLVVTFKYVSLVLKMNSHGEGGILTLSTLVSSLGKIGIRPLAALLGIIGVSLFFGDGVITPAISVLSAVEGLAVMHESLTSYILPTTIIVLTLLFFVQRYGSANIGRYFGPIMIVWFVTLAALGVPEIFKNPTILKALNPYYGIHFLLTHSWQGLLSMAGVILVLTGAEALYADLGHFGRPSIQLSWNYFICPALCLNYLGQGALLLNDPTAISNPFYLLAPQWALTGLIILATVSTVIASQSVLSGLFSVVNQSIAMGYLPRMRVINTSKKNIGQVFSPTINWIFYTFTIGAVLLFKTSDNLAVSYGLCVSGIMLITSYLAYTYISHTASWGLLAKTVIFFPLFFIDSLFVITNLVKFVEGAWFALALASLTYLIINTWIKGNTVLQNQKMNVHQPVKDFIDSYRKDYPISIPGVALFLCRYPHKIPSSLMMQLHHNKFLHETIILTSVVTKEVPYVKSCDRINFEIFTDNCYQIIANFGFKEIPSLHKVIDWLKENEKISQNEEVSIFLGRGIPVSSHYHNMNKISQKLYIVLAALSQNTTDYYKIPHHKVIELGVRYWI